MELRRRKFLHLAAGAAALPAASRFARAQSYPTRPVRIVVSFAAGGGADITARLMGRWLSERLGQSFVVENRPGAGGNIGTEMVVKASPDGYTLLMVLTPNAVNATLYDKLNFNLIRDIAPVAGIMRVPNVMEVHPSLPAKTVPEFIAYAKANPGKINYASAGKRWFPAAWCLGSKRRQSVVLIIRPAIFDCHIPVFEIASRIKAFAKAFDRRAETFSRRESRSPAAQVAAPAPPLATPPCRPALR